jgi:hypothetical protein
MRLAPVILLVSAALLLASCQKQLEAPTERGVCWHIVRSDKGQPQFNRLAAGQPDLEHCAAELEKMRLNFRALGANQDAVDGAFQGQFLFVRPEGVFTAQNATDHRYVLMVRTGDGRLAVPGAMPQ